MTTIKGILFDKDGTLLDFNGTWLEPYRQAAAYLHGCFGERADADMLLASGGFIAETETWQPDSLLASGYNQEIIEFWAETIGQPLGDDHQQALKGILARPGGGYATVVDDLKSLLAELRGPGTPPEIHLGLATMDDESSACNMLRALDAEALFDFVCGADSGHGVKPQAGMVLAFCRACGLRCDEVVMVGDSPRDLDMGKNAGVALTVGVLTGAHEAADLARADLVLESIAGLRDII